MKHHRQLSLDIYIHIVNDTQKQSRMFNDDPQHSQMYAFLHFQKTTVTYDITLGYHHYRNIKKINISPQSKPVNNLVKINPEKSWLNESEPKEESTPF